MRKKEGFTLIELLAVIVVIAIVSLISIPIVLNIIETARKGAIKSSAIGLMEAADIYYAKNISKIKEPIEFEINKGVQISTEKLEYKGNVNMGYLMLFKDNKKAVCVDDGTYSAHKGVNDKEVKVEEGICTGEYDEETKSYYVSSTSSGFASISIRSYENEKDLPGSGKANDIAIITKTKITGYYISSIAPTNPTEGMVWIVQTTRKPYYMEADNIRIGVSYTMQYENGKWNLKKAYVYNKGWTLLYYVEITDDEIDLENSNLGEIKIENLYEYTGEYQEFTALFSGYYNMELWGAQGGTNNATYPGGLGAYTSGDIYLEAGETIYIYVGGTTTTTTGGWNGGGDGLTAAQGSAGGGGGSTDVRLSPTSSLNVWNEFESLKSRIMVAAGGGGGTYYNGTYHGSGGAGGGLIGYDGTGVGYDGTGASQTYAGFSSYSTTAITTTSGDFGIGGRYYQTYSQAGGGGGYYGGGAGSFAGSAGGGGSSYVSGNVGCNSINNLSTKSNITFTGSYIHYSNKYFNNIKIIDGSGYSWTNSKQTFDKMPTHDGNEIMTGNNGNGYAKITLKTITQKLAGEIEKEVSQENRWDFTYSSNYQEFIVPKDGTYNVQLWGAEGGTNNSAYPGGLGAYTSGDIYLTKDTKLYIYVGGKSILTSGGWNGGGDGLLATSGSAGGGGGATDIRLISTSSSNIWNEFESLKSRIMVAAGGGGGTYYSGTYHGSGGAGGGLTGYDGTGVGYDGTGASINYGGLGSYDSTSTTATLGGFGFGGRYYRTWSQGGGGGGYYGGGAGSFAGSAGGGGSSYISGHDGSSSIAKESTNKKIIHTGSAYHYSGYYFTNTSMIDGQGYSWSVHKQSKTSMPANNSGQLATGNTGNGYAIITYKSKNKQKTEEIESAQKENERYWNYDTNYSYQEFIAPKSGIYKVQLWGAQGGTNNATYPGGLGAYTSGDIYLEEGTKLYVYVGGTTIPSALTSGGWNGGGDGLSATSGSAGGGGGATDIRLSSTTSLNVWNEFESLKSRIMVAAGGGGGTYYDGNYHGSGGAGGGLTGYDGTGSNYAGTGASTNYGGFSSYDSTATTTTLSGFGFGGRYYKTWSQGGGGGGYYGGGAGSFAGSAGGGGSSYISGHNGSSSIAKGSTTEKIIHTGSAYHYSGYYFTNTSMIDGQGYSWSTYKESQTSMPTHENNQLTVGNKNNGHAIITFVSKNTSTSDEIKKYQKENEYYWTYPVSYTRQDFTASKTGTYKIELWGAQGGTNDSAYPGGLGAYTSGEIYLKEGTKLYVYVGGTTISSNLTTGGWNGGGDGLTAAQGSAGGGGGSTDVRTVATESITIWNNTDSLKSRIMVAAGGGGGTNYSGTYHGSGGAGGGLIGYDGTGSNYAGTGGSQSKGGFSSYDSTATTATLGGFGFGGRYYKTWSQGGGGGGYYGGGAGSFAGSAGGGGSSYVSGHAGCIATTSSGTPKTDKYSSLSDSVSYTGYKFTNTQILDGTGYMWNTEKVSYSGIPTITGTSTTTGNSGNGYAKITYLGE